MPTKENLASLANAQDGRMRLEQVSSIRNMICMSRCNKAKKT